MINLFCPVPSLGYLSFLLMHIEHVSKYSFFVFHDLSEENDNHYVLQKKSLSCLMEKPYLHIAALTRERLEHGISSRITLKTIIRKVLMKRATVIEVARTRRLEWK